MIKKLFFAVSISGLPWYLQASDQDQEWSPKQITSVVVQEEGSSFEHELAHNNLFPHSEQACVVPMPVNDKECDFGQIKSRTCFVNGFNRLERSRFGSKKPDVMLFALGLNVLPLVSGVAQLLKSDEDYRSKIKMLVLKNPSNSMEHGVLDTLARQRNWFTYLPYIRWWLPGVVKKIKFFHNYDSKAESALSALAALSKAKIPVIILDTSEKREFSYNDGLYLYKQLSAQGNPVYFVETDVDERGQYAAKAQQTINTCYFQHGLTNAAATFFQDEQHQPSGREVKQKMRRRVPRGHYISNAIDIGTTVLATVAAVKILKKVYARLSS